MVLYHVSHVMKFFVHFCTLFGISCIFFTMFVAEAELKIKAPLSLQYELRQKKHIPQDKVLAQGRNYNLGFGFCSCSWKKSTIHFRLIHACDATPCNVKKAPKNYPKTFGFSLDPSSPILDNVQKQTTFFVEMTSLRQTSKYWIFFKFIASKGL